MMRSHPNEIDCFRLKMGGKMLHAPAYRPPTALRGRRLAFVALALCCFAGCNRPPGEPASGAAPMPGTPEAPDAGAAVLFGAGVLSDEREQWRITFTPDGQTAYFAASDQFFPFSRQATIYVSHLVDGAWTMPEVAPFSGRYSDIDPFITPDGERLYFSSIRPIDGVTRGDLDLWMVERAEAGWSEPVRLGPEVNSPDDELYPSASADGTLYFASGPIAPEPGKHWDIYSAERDGAGFRPRQKLGDAVNTEPTGEPGEGLQDAWEFNPEVSPDGRTLVFTSLRPGGHGLGDLYVSHLRNGVWSPARNLGPAVNTADDEYHPTLSHDGKALYFVRRIHRPDASRSVPGDFYRIETGSLDLR